MTETTTIPLIEKRAKLYPLPMPQNDIEREAFANTLGRLNESAQADGHTVLAPTHIVMKGNDVVGYASIAGMPTMHVWMDTQRTNALDSTRMLEFAEYALRERGIRHVLMPCAEDSPFAQHMERLGFRRLGPTVLYIKEV